MRDAFQACFPPSAEESASEENEEAKALGLPIDQTKIWRKLARKREQKAVHFLADKEASFFTMASFFIHYSLFKNATWLSERVSPEEAEQLNPQDIGQELVEGVTGEQGEIELELGDSNSSNIGATTACFFKSSLNPATTSMGELMSALSSPDHPLWGPLAGFYGQQSTWEDKFKRCCRRTLFTVMGQLWRKLIEPWKRFPWKLANITDVQAPMDVRQGLAQELFSVKPCCLDCFSVKLRSVLGSHERLLDEDVQAFLAALFERAVPTSTYIERMFSRFSKWCEKSGPKLNLFQCAAKHVTSRFRDKVAIWRAKARASGILPPAASNLRRPDWVQPLKRGRSQTGLHLFAKELGTEQGKVGFDKARALWRLKPQNEKDAWSVKAKAGNALAAQSLARQRRATEPVVGGPWSVGTSEGFCLSEHVINSVIDQMPVLAEKWKCENNSLMDAPIAFQEGSEDRAPLFAGCPAGYCVSGLNEAQQDVYHDLHDLLVHTIMTHGPGPSQPAAEPLVLRYSSVFSSQIVYVSIAFHTRKQPIEAACIVLHPMPRNPGQALRDWLHDVALCVRLAGAASDWTLEIIEPDTIEALSQFIVKGAQLVDMGSFQTWRGAKKEQSMAMSALRLLSHHPSKGRKRKGTAGERPSGLVPPKRKKKGQKNPCKSNSHTSASEAGLESENEGPLADLPARDGVCE